MRRKDGCVDYLLNAIRLESNGLEYRKHVFFTGSVEGLLSRRHRGRHLAGMMGTIIGSTMSGNDNNLKLGAN